MRGELARILDGLPRDQQGIYGADVQPDARQAEEVRLREAVARCESGDPLREVADHHSIRVMDGELRAFLRRIPARGVVVDVGGGWGWHWRSLADARPDVSVVVVDFVRSNLQRAARLLAGLVDAQVYLVHADATRLPFPPRAFDGFWSVQALQHVPDFEHAVREAYRVLTAGGQFACYSLNRPRVIEGIYRLLGKPYHVHGTKAGSFFLSRASDDQAALVGRIFGAPVVSRYTELLFHPDLRMRTGARESPIGAIDAHLSSSAPFLSWVARQRSYHTWKPR